MARTVEHRMIGPLEPATDKGFECLDRLGLVARRQIGLHKTIPERGTRARPGGREIEVLVLLGEVAGRRQPTAVSDSFSPDGTGPSGWLKSLCVVELMNLRGVHSSLARVSVRTASCKRPSNKCFENNEMSLVVE